jgi:hypothetical protein
MTGAIQRARDTANVDEMGKSAGDEGDASRLPINVPLNIRALPAEVQVHRDRVHEEDAVLEGIVKPRIEAHVATCRLVAKQLQDWHQRVADKTDLQLTGYSRGAAVWLLAGRCLGLLEALLVQVEAGIDNEALITGRAIHEAARILLVFCDAEEEELLRVWLDDEGKHGYVRPSETRAAQERFEEKLNEAMEREGLRGLNTTTELSAQIFDEMSRVAHSRRSSCVNSVWQAGRQMAYGRHPSPMRRASSASWGGAMTVEVANAVGDALRAFFGGGFFEKEIAPLIKSVEAIGEAAPLEAAAIQQAVNELARQ